MMLPWLLLAIVLLMIALPINPLVVLLAVAVLLVLYQTQSFD